MADPAKLARAQHSYNLLIGLDMSVPERAAMLNRVLRRADQAPLDALAEAVVAHGPVEALTELVAVGLDSAALEALTEALYAVDLSAIIGEFLVEMTGEQPGEPAPAPEEEAPAAVEVDVAASAETAPLPDFTWDAALVVFDPCSRRHHLTLLRRGTSTSSAPIPPTEGFGPLVERVATTLPEASPDLLEALTETFVTPECDPEPLLEALLGTDRPDQLYLITLTHSLPNPCLHRQHFELTEPGENALWQGRKQVLHTELSYRAAGLSLQDVRAHTAASWNSSAKLSQEGFGYRPPPLTSGPLATLPLQCDWQLRAGWSLQCRALHPGAQALSVTIDADLSGALSLDGKGHLQEELGASAGLAIGLFDADEAQVHTGEEPLPPADWQPAADVGFGALGVLSRAGEERNLTASGTHLSHLLRPTPGIPPRITRQAAVAASGSLTGALTGALIVEASAQLKDELADFQSTGHSTAQVSAPVTARVTLSDGHRSLTLHLTAPDQGSEESTDSEDLGDGMTRAVAHHSAPAGTVEVDGQLRYALDWQTQTTTLTAQHSESLTALSAGDWLGGGESHRDPVTASHTVALAAVAGGYRLWTVLGEE